MNVALHLIKTINHYGPTLVTMTLHLVDKQTLLITAACVIVLTCRLDTGVLCRLMAAPIWLPWGRRWKYSVLSSADSFSTGPSILTFSPKITEPITSRFMVAVKQLLPPCSQYRQCNLTHLRIYSHVKQIYFQSSLIQGSPFSQIATTCCDYQVLHLRVCSPCRTIKVVSQLPN